MAAFIQDLKDGEVFTFKKNGPRYLFTGFKNGHSYYLCLSDGSNYSTSTLNIKVTIV